MVDLIVINSLYRSELLENIPNFINSKNDKETINYLDNCFEDILKETYGIIIYQEQVMQIIQLITGVSLGEAENIRRILRKIKITTVKEQEKIFFNNAISNGFSIEKIKKIFNKLVLVANISFNKAHTVAYTKMAYQTAYLKANFPNEFNEACNIFNNQIDD